MYWTREQCIPSVWLLTAGMLCWLSLPSLHAQDAQEAARRMVDENDPRVEQVRRGLVFGGDEREYFLQLPAGHDPERSYWLLVAIPGGSLPGSDPKAARYGHWAPELGLDAIVLTPTLDVGRARAFPALGEDAFLRAVVADVRAQYRLREKILLAGYSGGGQFSHRFALRNPNLIFACAPHAAGSWTTPDGRFLASGFGEVRDAATTLLSAKAAESVPKSARKYFHPEVASVAALPALPGAQEIPFHVMCGSLDAPRYENAKAFAASLADAGYVVRTQWPRTAHAPRDTSQVPEWEMFRRQAIEFFLDVTAGH